MKYKLPFQKKQTPVVIDTTKKDVGMMTPLKNDFVQSIKDATHNPSDLIIKSIPPNITLIYLDNLISDVILNDHIISRLINNVNESPETIKASLSIPKDQHLNSSRCNH